METKLIFSKDIAYFLRCKGFKIIKVEPNPNKPQFDAYRFEDTERLKECLDEYMEEKNKEKKVIKKKK